MEITYSKYGDYYLPDLVVSMKNRRLMDALGVCGSGI